MDENIPLTIGRDAQNIIRINNVSVSSNHAAITKQADGTYFLEDKNSTNGTFVNGVRIDAMIVTLTDKIKMGNYEISVTELLELASDAIEVKFRLLEKVSLDYHKKKRLITQRENKIYTGITIIGLIAIGGLSRVLGIGGALGGIGITGTIATISIKFLNSQEKKEDLFRKFHEEYVCPNCHTFLGDSPWTYLFRRGQCLSCRTVWNPNNAH